MSYDKTYIFQRFGKVIKWFNSLEGWRLTSVPLWQGESNAMFSADSHDRIVEDDLSTDFNSWLSQVGSMRDGLESRCGQYIRDVVAWKIASARTVEGEVLDDLVRAMNLAVDKVQTCVTAAGAATSSLTNSNAGTIAVGAPTVMARNASFEIECTDANTQGAEGWTVRSSVNIDGSQTASAAATTGTNYTWSAAGISFLISVGSTILEYNDDLNQLSNWVLSGYSTANTDKGKLYVKIDVPTYGTNRISLYSNAARTSTYLVAQGSRSYAGSVTLAQQNSSGLSGTVDFTPAYGTGDTDIYLVCPMFVDGDKFFFSTTTDDGGVFFKFFRDEYDKEMPNGTGGAVTIPDAWAI